SFNLRLVNGTRAGEGRVEIFFNGTWGTVCDDNFDGNAATAVCRQLGFLRGEPFGQAFFGQGTGPILLDGFNCNSTVSRLDQCTIPAMASHDCGHVEDAGVRCTTDIRLVNGSTAGEGRVEVFFNGAWGTVCDDNFDANAANAVCRQLGFPLGTPFGNAAFGQGTGPIQLDGFTCSSTASRLDSCTIPAWATHDCSHSEDAGVRCGSQSFDVRLVNGSRAGEGRVEILYGGAWGTVCDDNFDGNAATAVCRQLGFLRGEPFGQAFFGQGTGPILLDGFNCTSSVSRLDQCTIPAMASHDCSHVEDAGVRCTTDIRLVNGSRAGEGRVEVFFNGAWGTVCDDNFDANAANAVCRQLGFPPGIPFGNAAFGQGTGPIQLDGFICSSTASRLDSCTIPAWATHDCSHSEDAGVRCGGSQSFDVRLVSGSRAGEGRVEILYGGAWGTVCDDNFDGNAATAVCRQLGFLRGEPFGQAFFGQGTGPILLDGFNCTSSVSRLDQCTIPAMASHDCSHVEDAGVRCTTDIRLVNGSTAGEGRVEVFYNGTWGTVCDDNFDANAANAVCRQLGFLSGTPFGNAAFGQGTGPIQLDGFTCSSTASRLDSCTILAWATHDCSHSEDAGVRCGGKMVLHTNLVTLIGFSDNS
ncbi:hypothetical protein VOLCADRAFT_68493, partial [Volvox carteri f. nagariensis]